MISIRSLAFEYTNGLPLFQNFNWAVSRGETWAILGPSGCGKTTLLYLLAGLKFPASGEVKISGEQITRPRPQSGLILQDYGLLPWSTVRENVELGLKVRNFYGPDGKHTPNNFISKNNTETWLNRLGLSEVADKFPGQLSGGQRQRTAIARTLALEPDLLLMDEPFSSLDAITREDLQNLTLSLCAEKSITFIIVTHAIEEAAVLGRKILLLGTTPNDKPYIVENPNAGSSGYRNTAEFHATCEHLWSEMQKKDITA
ncbi:MAG: ABC transporter ATP-binding protein [Anaerolineales bacterium]|jgi:ABC-type nitrate/sulfonate/bicarbonate transport system ATPase subunit|uniref:ABC transporter ATP-binding protein n=1 Tax=Candidatus Villigracilis vicinus TaxID=3140679 RepID=UPI0031370ED4|nr:ABC transporter ATP-binding protein [Anaerolineales bacterium]MBK9781470.1 ABC transporter ATP-binding protein [Anaerolineales bacterium]